MDAEQARRRASLARRVIMSPSATRRGADEALRVKVEHPTGFWRALRDCRRAPEAPAELIALSSEPGERLVGGESKRDLLDPFRC